MTQVEFWEKLKAFFDECHEISKVKNRDYAGKNEPFKNFMLVEQLGICSVEVGMMVRMCDKFARLANLLHRDPAVVSESIGDTRRDLSNYSGIWDIWEARKAQEGFDKIEPPVEKIFYCENCCSATTCVPEFAQCNVCGNTDIKEVKIVPVEKDN